MITKSNVFDILDPGDRFRDGDDGTSGVVLAKHVPSGMAWVLVDGRDAPSPRHRADFAIYRSKKIGKKHVLYVTVNADGSGIAASLPPKGETLPEVVAVKRVEIEEGVFDA